ncbi:MFS transporter [Paenibacillus zeisoli]|uniref:MFS transporter n=1 Tax=Paenibacillus zeisoli TaxID=2496267 RepID=UPI00163CE3C6|nr:MFS transporter [Paenibacillus zeisoli]
MKPETRIYIDAVLQNMKNILFFMFLPILIARLGASPLEITLSTSLPPLMSAISVVFVTRLLPCNFKVYYSAGILRQMAFLCIAFAVLLPHSIAWILVFWSINCIVVMILNVQQHSLIKHNVAESNMSTLFGNIRIIAILVTIVCSYSASTLLDRYDTIFPYNYFICMIIGAVCTFTGMNLMARLAPKESKKIKLQWKPPLRRLSPFLIMVGFMSLGGALPGSLWVIYHVNVLHFSNMQIALFSICSGVVSAICIPLGRRWIKRFGYRNTLLTGYALLMCTVSLYGLSHTYAVLLGLQIVRDLIGSFTGIAQETLSIEESRKHEDEAGFFSDVALLTNVGGALGPFAGMLMLQLFNIQTCFVLLGVIALVPAAWFVFRMNEKSQPKPGQIEMVPLVK